MGNCVEINNQQNKQNQTNQTSELKNFPSNSYPTIYYMNNMNKNAFQNNQIIEENGYERNRSLHMSSSKPNNYQMYPTKNVMPINTTNAVNIVNKEENKNLGDIRGSQKEKENQENLLLQKKIINEQANEKIQMQEKINNMQTELDKLRLEQNEKIQRLTSELTRKNQEIFQLKNSYSELLFKYNELIPITVGLNNIGATCYMNATLQSLSNVKELSNYFLHKFIPNAPNQRLSNEYYTVVKNLWDRNNNGKAYSPDSFKNILSQMNPLFAGIAANDSKDLINFLLETFHTELNKPTAKINNNLITPNDQLDEKRMLDLFVIEMKSSYNSPISNLFYGVLETQSKCTNCNRIKYNFQIYSFIEFPLEQVYNYCLRKNPRNNYITQGIPTVDLYTCFEHYQLLSPMTGDNQIFCNECGRAYDAFYGTLIYSLPHYLIINLNRGKNAVFQCNVKFPELLKLHNFVKYQEGKTVFQLVSVICHYGPSSMGGHFIAYCRHHKDNCWYNYNDSIVTKCTNHKPYLTGMPYILFYKTLDDE